MGKLQKLVAAEERVRQQRMEHFRSENFCSSNPGPLFPTSWKLQIEVEQGRGTEKNCLRPLPQFRGLEKTLAPVLASCEPIFDRQTEDGLRFRIYRVGSLEIRTAQEHDGAEIVMEVLSSVAAELPSDKASDAAGVAKAVMYVEHCRESLPDSSGFQTPPCHYFVVLET